MATLLRHGVSTPRSDPGRRSMVGSTTGTARTALLLLAICVGCSPDGDSADPSATPGTVQQDPGPPSPGQQQDPGQQKPAPRIPSVLLLDSERYPVTTGAAPGYVDDRACGRCHTALYRSFQTMGMARSFYRPTPEGVIEDFENNHYYHEASNRHYEMHRVDGRYVMKRYRVDDQGARYAEISQEIDWIMGSGNHGRTYLYQTDLGELYQLPILWYAGGVGWGMAPGYDHRDHDGFNRQIKHECMFCHNGVPQLPEDSDSYAMPSVFPQQLPSGLGCQRCHGPGADHVWRATQPDTTLRTLRGTILNPADLPPERQDEICYQCHLQPLASKKSIQRVVGRNIYSYRPGEPLDEYLVHVDFGSEAERAERFEINHHPYRLRQSRCYTESGMMTCLSCHDPHRKIPPEERAQHYRERCLKCHALEDCDVDAMQSGSPAGISTADCTVCHMPEHRPEDVTLVLMTDHKIRRSRAPESFRAPRRRVRSKLYEKANRYHHGKGPGAGNFGSLYTAIGLVQEGVHTRGIEIVESAIAATGTQGVEAYLRLALAQARRGRYEDAVASYAQVLARGDLPVAHNNTALALSKLGRTDEARAALELGCERFPDDPDLRLNLGVLLLQAGDMVGARTHLEKAMALRPNVPMVHFALSGVLIHESQLDAAVTRLRAAIAHNPDMGNAYARLGEVLASRNDNEGALRVLRQGVRSDPRNPRVHGQLAWVSMLRGLREPAFLPEALRHGQRAAELNKADAVVSARLAMLLVLNRKLDEALAALVRARELGADPCSCDLIEAIALAQLGKRREARAAYDRAQAAAGTPTTYRIRNLLLPFARKTFGR